MHRIAPALASLAVDVDDLYLDERNPRVGDAVAVARSLERFGQRVPIVYQMRSATPRGKKRRTVIAGNTRLVAARNLGWTEIAAIDADDLTPIEAQAFAVADNRTSDLATYDEVLLRGILFDLYDEDPTLVDDAGFADVDFVRFIANDDEFSPEPGGQPRLDQPKMIECPNCGETFPASS